MNCVFMRERIFVRTLSISCPLTLSPSMAVMTMPEVMPALAAGVSGLTEMT